MSKFKDYTTSTAFSISLSRGMCEGMEFLFIRNLQKQTQARGMQPVAFAPLLTSMHSLSRRGLAEHDASVPEWRLTDAGHALYPLLVMAELVRNEDELKGIYCRGAA